MASPHHHFHMRIVQTNKLQKRRRREYRQARRAAFARPEPGFSMYEGRTRGKRMRYTFDDGDEDDDDDDTQGFSDATSNRRSARQSGRSTPADIGPQYTASGRQVRPRQGGEYGASMLSTQVSGPDELGDDYSEKREASDSEPVRGGARAPRATRAVNGGSSLKKRKRINGEDDDEGSLGDLSDDAPSGEEWDSQANGDDEEDDDAMPDADDEADGDNDVEGEDEDGEPKRLVITLKTTTGNQQANGAAEHTEVSPPIDAEANAPKE